MTMMRHTTMRAKTTTRGFLAAAFLTTLAGSSPALAAHGFPGGTVFTSPHAIAEAQAILEEVERETPGLAPDRGRSGSPVPSCRRPGAGNRLAGDASTGSRGNRPPGRGVPSERAGAAGRPDRATGCGGGGRAPADRPHGARCCRDR